MPIIANSSHSHSDVPRLVLNKREALPESKKSYNWRCMVLLSTGRTAELRMQQARLSRHVN